MCCVLLWYLVEISLLIETWIFDSSKPVSFTYELCWAVHFKALELRYKQSTTKVKHYQALFMPFTRELLYDLGALGALGASIMRSYASFIYFEWWFIQLQDYVCLSWKQETVSYLLLPKELMWITTAISYWQMGDLHTYV